MRNPPNKRGTDLVWRSPPPPPSSCADIFLFPAIEKIPGAIPTIPGGGGGQQRNPVLRRLPSTTPAPCASPAGGVVVFPCAAKSSTPWNLLLSPLPPPRRPFHPPVVSADGNDTVFHPLRRLTPSAARRAMPMTWESRVSRSAGLSDSSSIDWTDLSPPSPRASVRAACIRAPGRHLGCRLRAHAARDQIIQPPSQTFKLVRCHNAPHSPHLFPSNQALIHPRPKTHFHSMELCFAPRQTLAGWLPSRPL